MIRWAVLAHVLDLLRSADQLSGVLVASAQPGDLDHRHEMIWAEEIDGDVSIPVGTGGRKVRDDIFTIPLTVKVRDDDLDRTRLRCGAILSAIDSVLADDPTLGTFEVPGVGFVVDATLGDVVDDARQTAADGSIAFGQAVLTVHSRLT